MTSSKKYMFLKFRCEYDNFVSLSTSQGGIKSYLQLMLFPTIKKKKNSMDDFKSYFVLKNGMFLPIFALYCP